MVCNTHFLTGEKSEQRHVSFKLSWRMGLKMMKQSQLHANYNRVLLQHCKSSCAHLYQVRIWLPEDWSKIHCFLQYLHRWSKGKKKNPNPHSAPSLEEKYIIPTEQLITQVFSTGISGRGETTSKWHISSMIPFSSLSSPMHRVALQITVSFPAAPPLHTLIATNYISRNITQSWFSSAILTMWGI